jgi:N6-L-threonylcarbamoyladenine synthase
VLAIETSCDDTCVALLDRQADKVELVQHIKSTLNSTKEGGIIPTRAFDHHQRHMGQITKELFEQNNIGPHNPPDLICATRGPGMKGSLSIGLDFAKGLSLAFDKPLVGVHHMLGHLLVPRYETSGQSPAFPFLNLLISGGHTMLVLSKSLLEHEILCDTLDVAAGDAVDKCARELGLKSTNLGKALEQYVLENKEYWDYQKIDTPTPLSNKPGRVDQLNFSFGAFQGTLRKLIESNSLDLSHEPAVKSAAYQIQNAIFEHVITKIKLTIEKKGHLLENVNHLVASGGVASNFLLRSKLDEYLNNHGIETSYPSLELCTDNAVMIGWAGIELYEQERLTTDHSAVPISKWPLSEITNVDGWIQNK